jgi:hypothetical protein
MLGRYGRLPAGLVRNHPDKARAQNLVAIGALWRPTVRAPAGRQMGREH